MVDPNDIVLGGWDISKANLADAMERAQVLDFQLQSQLMLRDHMKDMVPLPSIYDKDFIDANQESRADNVIPGTKKEQVEVLKGHMRDFRKKNGVDKVIVLWTANTERYANIIAGVNDTKENLAAAIERNESEIAPSTLFAYACISEGVPFVNGSPQNTFVPGLIEYAIERWMNIHQRSLWVARTRSSCTIHAKTLF